MHSSYVEFGRFQCQFKGHQDAMLSWAVTMYQSDQLALMFRLAWILFLINTGGKAYMYL